MVVVLVAEAGAQPVPAGDEFRVNSYTTGLQLAPSVCTRGDGSFVVAYDDIGLTPGPNPSLAPGRDGSGFAIVGRRFDADGGTVGTEFLVNTYSTGDQAGAVVACAEDGGFLVVWRDIDVPPDGGRDAVFARAYGANGQPRATPFRVDFGPYGSGVSPSKPSACTAGDEFVVVWTSSQFNVTARRFASDGTPLGGAVAPDDPDVGPDGGRCCGSASGFVIAWNAYGIFSGGDATDVRVQRFTPSGIADGVSFFANSYTLGYQNAQVLACDDAGEFVVAWTSTGNEYLASQDGDEEGVFARVFDELGAPATGEIHVNAYTTGTQITPTVAMDSAGRFVVAWQSMGPTGSRRSVFSRAFGAGGAPLGSEFRVNTYTGRDAEVPEIAGRGNGDFVVTWETINDGSGDSISARRFEFPGGASTTVPPTSSTTTPSTSTTQGPPTTTLPPTTSTLPPTTSTLPPATTSTTVPVGQCGDPVADSSLTGDATPPRLITASDSLFVLHAAVGSESCAACVCDVDSSGAVSAGDALAVLRFAVGLDIELVCPSC